MTTIQPAATHQANEILAVLVAAFEQYRQILDPPSGVFRETPRSIQHALEVGGGFVAMNSQQIVGMVLYQPYPDHMYLGRLGVLPAYRGQHIASQLIVSVEQRALEQGLPAVQLGVRLALTGNQALFERLGYTIIGRHSHEGYNEVTYLSMQKRLD